MKAELLERCELFIENRNIIKGEFHWESEYIYPLCAGLCVSKNAKADARALRDCINLLKQHTGPFSNFRGTSKMATITMLSLTDNPTERMERMLEVYNRLKQAFWGSEYLTVAAAAIAELAEPSQYEQIAQHTRSIYNRMKANHRFLTSGEDSAYAVLLALSGLDESFLEQETERCYSILKTFFFMNGNAVQSLSHILALGEGTAEQKCDRVMNLFNVLKARGHKYGTSYELATLGALALTDIEIETLAQDMIEVDDFLATQKGFGMLGVGAKQRLMYAGMLTMCNDMPDGQTIQVAAMNGVVSMVIAQQAAMCAVIVATSAAMASSSSSQS